MKEYGYKNNFVRRELGYDVSVKKREARRISKNLQEQNIDFNEEDIIGFESGNDGESNRAALFKNIQKRFEDSGMDINVAFAAAEHVIYD